MFYSAPSFRQPLVLTSPASVNRKWTWIGLDKRILHNGQFC